MRSSKTPFKSGYVAIAGKPNVGKSTLLNQILDRKLAIVSPKAQTTRHRILGILNNSRYQVIFWDTPGFSPNDGPPISKTLRQFRNRIPIQPTQGRKLL